ncbi:hypothetical protein TNCV_3347141 [Trichonephila clavipes]|nr:hypothetical protein TNCV_3347141 [Trichonephila clavipes]
MEAKTSSHWCGGEVKTGVLAQVSSSSLDHGSKLRGPESQPLKRGGKSRNRNDVTSREGERCLNWFSIFDHNFELSGEEAKRNSTANDKIDKCATCVDCEDLCDILEEILDTLSDPDTPERLRLVNLIQWTALKCSRKSIRLQNQEFKDYIRDIEQLNPIPTAPASQPKRKQAKRQTASPRKDVPSKKQAKSEQPLPLPSPPLPLSVSKALSSMEEGELSADESSEEVSTKIDDKPAIAPSSPAAAAAGSVGAPGPRKDKDGFTVVGRNGRRIAPIVIDSQRNATELLDQLGKFCDTPLEGRYENEKLRVLPASAEEHRLTQKYISDNELRSHTFD